MRVGTDTGGTFTDVVGADGAVAKVPSTPDDPGRAVAEGLAALSGGAGPATTLAHGTTVATNALLERRGATVALVTTEGFEDVIEIARQDRPSLYDLRADRPAPLVPRSLRFGVRERLDASGRVLVPLDPASVDAVVAALPREVEAVAVCLLHADLAADHEQAVAEILAAAGLEVSRSSALCPERREYERTSTVVLDAYLRPACRAYLQRLGGLAREVLVLSSAGGLLPVAVAAEQPARLLLSGPAGGAAAAAAVAAANGFPDAVSFDMGGTSTDVALVLGGRPEPAAEREVAGFPVRLPSLAVHTVGAGGGSIAAIDAGGALVVGPRSAGAVPGPACYGRGGTLPTVTDADLVLGRIPAGATFPGLGRLDVAAARAALAAAGVDAAGVVAVVNASMEQAIRRVSVEQGVDPRGLALVAFGGAGPLHACDLADALGMPAVIVPARAGVLSAVGVLAAPRTADRVHSWQGGTDADLARAVAGVAEAAVGDIRAGADGPGAVGGGAAGGGAVRVDRWVDCRYLGQSHELRVPWGPGWRDDFHALHRRVNGFARPGDEVEVVAVRAAASVASPVGVLDLPAPARPTGVGPVVLAEDDCTIWVPAGWRAERGEAGALVLRRGGTA